MLNLKVYPSFRRCLAITGTFSRLLQERLNGHLWLNRFWGITMHTGHMFTFQQLLRQLVRQGTVNANLRALPVGSW